MGAGGGEHWSSSDSFRKGWVEKLTSDRHQNRLYDRMTELQQGKTSPVYGREGRHGLALLSLDEHLCESRVLLQANMEDLMPDIKYSFLKLYSTGAGGVGGESIRASCKGERKSVLSKAVTFPSDRKLVLPRG